MSTPSKDPPAAQPQPRKATPRFHVEHYAVITPSGKLFHRCRTKDIAKRECELLNDELSGIETAATPRGERSEIHKGAFGAFIEPSAPPASGAASREPTKFVSILDDTEKFLGKVYDAGKASGVASSEPTEDIGRKIASDFVYAVHKWRGMSAGFMQAQVRRLAEPINAALEAEREKVRDMEAESKGLREWLIGVKADLLAAQAVVEDLLSQDYNLASTRFRLRNIDLSALREHDAEVRKPLVEALTKLRRKADNHELGNVEARNICDDALAQVKEGK